MKQLLSITLLSLLSAFSFAAESISATDLAAQIDAGNAPIILDVRSEDEYLAGHVPGAILVPVKSLAEHLDNLKAHEKDTVVLYCQSGRRASNAATLLEDAGFRDVRLLEGNYPAWATATKDATP